MNLFKKIVATTLAATLVTGLVTVTPGTVNAAVGGSDMAKTFNGHTYALFKKEMNWHDAKSYCEKLGGHLVTITSEEENQFLYETFMTKMSKSVSIGLSDEAVEGNWTWITKEATEYTNWNVGEPNNQSSEDYVLIKTNGTWNDGHLDRENWPFICEWDTTDIKKTTLYKNAKFTLKTDFTSTVKYTSSNKSVAKVNKNGIVTAKKKGQVAITATCNGESKVYLVTVKNPKLNKKKVKLSAGDKFKIKITGKVGKAKFTSTNKSVAKVSSKGKITAKKKGKAVIKVKTNGITLKCKVTVK